MCTRPQPITVISLNKPSTRQFNLRGCLAGCLDFALAPLAPQIWGEIESKFLPFSPQIWGVGELMQS